MPANIFGERLTSVREPAWHRIGQVINEPMSVADAFIHAGIDYDVTLAPLWAQYELDGEIVPMELTNKRAVIREEHTFNSKVDAAAVLGIVSDGYNILQNRELAAMLENVNTKWAIETVGALGNGEVAWLMLDAGSYTVGEDKCKHYLMVSTGHDGTHSVQVALVKVRVVCWNTYHWALDSASMKYTIPHKGNVKDETKFAIDIIAGAERTINTSIKVEEKMVNTRVTEEDVKELINAAYPMPRKPRNAKINTAAQSESLSKQQVKQLLTSSGGEGFERYEKQKERAEALRSGAFHMYEEMNLAYPWMSNTAWSALNAITETSNWRQGRNADTGVMFGARKDEMTRGLKAVGQLIGV